MANEAHVSESEHVVREMLSLRLACGASYGELAQRYGMARQRVQQLLSPPSSVILIVRKRATREDEGVPRCEQEQCGKPAPDGHVHHKIVTGLEHLADYNAEINLLFLCRSCHRKQEVHGTSKRKWRKAVAEFIVSHPEMTFEQIRKHFHADTREVKGIADDYGIPRLRRVVPIRGRRFCVGKLFDKVTDRRVLILQPPVRKEFDYLAANSQFGWFVFPVAELPKKQTMFAYKPHPTLGKTRGRRHDWMKYFEAWPDPGVKDEILKLRK